MRVDKTGCVTATPGNPHRNVSGKCRQPDANLQHRTAEGKKGLDQLTYLGDWTGFEGQTRCSLRVRSDRA